MEKDGTWREINITLNQLERLQKERKPLPSLGLVDSQSIKLVPPFCKSRGIDGNKKVNGRKRHILVDVLGRIYACHVHAANFHDSPQGVHLLDHCLDFGDRLETIMGDNSYKGTFCEAVEECEMKFETPNRTEGQKDFVVEANNRTILSAPTKVGDAIIFIINCIIFAPPSKCRNKFDLMYPG